MEHRAFKFEVKDLDQETGVFSGHAAVFGNKDLGGDIIEPGAFSQTLKHKKGKAVLLESHDANKRLGVVYLAEDGKGLKVEKGVLNLDKQAGRDALADLKFQLAHGVPMEMSIGYDAVKKEFRDDVRVLKEVRLWEVSLVTFAMNPKAQVAAVKAADVEELLEEIRGAVRGEPEVKSGEVIDRAIETLQALRSELAGGATEPAEAPKHSEDVSVLVAQLRQAQDILKGRN